VSGPSIESELDALLSEPVSSVRRRESTAFDELATPFQDSLVLFGAGELGRKTLAGLRRIGVEPLAFADNNPALWGREIEGLRVFELPDAARQFGQRAAFVITIWGGYGSDTMGERREQLAGLNCTRIVAFAPLFWKYPEVFLPHYALDLPHKVYQHAEDVRRALALFSDEPSRHEYLAQVKWRTVVDFDGLPKPVAHEMYFPGDLADLLPNEVFVDCGAFDGDTIRTFLRLGGEVFGGIVAYEPDPANFRSLERFVSTLPQHIRARLQMHPEAVGAQRSRVRFKSTGTASSAVGSGGLEVECVTLDESLGDQRPSYLKIDVEASELAALAGARRTIRQWLPVVAICAYHRQDHLWRIPLLVNPVSAEYRFFLRPHGLDVWDLVCYAIPASRLKTPQ